MAMERDYHTNNYHTADRWEILHQLIDGKHPIIYRVSTIQGGGGGAGFDIVGYQFNPWCPISFAMPNWEATGGRGTL